MIFLFACGEHSIAMPWNNYYDSFSRTLAALVREAL